jgi:hypothetical protein
MPPPAFSAKQRPHQRQDEEEKDKQPENDSANIDPVIALGLLGGKLLSALGGFIGW